MYVCVYIQKLLVCDDGNKEELAFIGGVDLTDGRYDTGMYTFGAIRFMLLFCVSSLVVLYVCMYVCMYLWYNMV